MPRIFENQYQRKNFTFVNFELKLATFPEFLQNFTHKRRNLGEETLNLEQYKHVYISYISKNAEKTYVYLRAKIGVDTAVNEPIEVGTQLSKGSRTGHSPA